MPTPRFSDVFFAEVDRRELALHAVAREAGIPYDRLKKFGQKHRAGKNPATSAEDAAALARVLGTTVDAMLFQDGVTSPAGPIAVKTASELVTVWDVEASAGDGIVAPEYETMAGRLAFPAGYLSQITTTAPEHLQILSVKGRSMLTTLDHDDVVMIDRTKRNLGFDGIYVLRLDDTIHVKRIGRSSTRGMVRIVSDNSQEYAPFERPISDIDVLGRVIWAGKKL